MGGLEHRPRVLSTDDLREYLEIPFRRPFHILIPLVLITLGALGASYLVPKRYKSSTLILVESEKIPDTVVQRPSSDRGRLQTVKQQVLSRTRLERVISELNPYPESMATTPLSAILDRMRLAISVRVKENDAFFIEFEHRDPQTAMAVANRLTTLFIEESALARERETEEATQFIESQLTASRHEIEAKEEALRIFKEKHIGTLPEQLQANLSTLQRLQLEQQGVAADLEAALGRLGQVEDNPAVAASPGSGRVDPRGAAAELGQLRAELAVLRTRYTEEHPDVKELLSRIARLEKAAESGQKTPSEVPLPSRELALARREVEILKAKRQDLDARVKVFEARVDQTPNTEQELANHERDFGRLKENYLAILNKKMSARMAESLEKRWEGDRFRIVDPAHLPQRPFFPNRMLFLFTGLAGGLLIGIAFAVGAELLDPTLKAAHDLELLVAAPVLAVLPHVQLPSRRGPPATAPVQHAPAARRHPEPAHVTPVHVTRNSPEETRTVLETAAEAVPAAESPAAEPAVWAEELEILESPAATEPPAAPEPEAASPPTVEPALAFTEAFPPSEDVEVWWDVPPEPEPPPPPPPSQGGDFWSAIVSAILKEQAAGSPALPPAAPVSPPAQAAPPVAPPPAEAAPPVAEADPPVAEPEPLQAPVPDATALIRLTSPALDGSGITFEAGARERVLGSGPDSDVRVPLANVEPVHARVVQRGDGLWILDTGTLSGTYVNGTRIERESRLKEGDHVFLGPPGARQSAKLVIEGLDALTPGAALDPDRERPAEVVPPASVPPAGTAGFQHAPDGARPAAAQRVPAPARKSRSQEPGMRRRRRRSTPIVGAAALLAGGATGALFHQLAARATPVVASVVPPRADPGEVVRLTGQGFDAALEGNLVRFGDQAARVLSASERELSVAVPPELATRAGAFPVTVEVRAHRSNSASFDLSAAPRIVSLDPPVALAGQEVTAAGHNLGGGPATVSVGGVTAKIVAAQPQSIRFVVPPELPVVEGAAVPVAIRVGAASAPPVSIVLGHLPIVTSVEPAQGRTGDAIKLRGYGFETAPGVSQVSMGGAPALTIGATRTELTVVVPGGTSFTAVVPLDVSVQTRDGVFRSASAFTRVRPPSGSFVPRFFPAPAPAADGVGRVYLSTELGPVLLLSGAAGAHSTAERAAAAGTALNELVDAGAKPFTLELREAGASIGLAGGPKVLLAATPEDVAAYAEHAESPALRKRLTPRMVASHWLALLQDYLALFLQHERPTRVLEVSPRGQVLLDIYTDALHRTGPGGSVPTETITRLFPQLGPAIEEMALSIPADDQPSLGTAVVGRWEGTIEERATGARPIHLRLRLQGKRLEGTLTTGAGPLTVDSRLREVAYTKGALTFVLGDGASALRFQGRVEQAALTGLIRSGRDGKDPAGFFSLHFVE